MILMATAAGGQRSANSQLAFIAEEHSATALAIPEWITLLNAGRIASTKRAQDDHVFGTAHQLSVMPQEDGLIAAEAADLAAQFILTAATQLIFSVSAAGGGRRWFAR